MPLYHQVILLRPLASPEALAKLFKLHTSKILALGGTSRLIENHGVRPLPERTKAKYVNAQGNKIYWDARYVSAYFDVTPKALTDINRILKLDEIVIRSHTIRVPSAVQKCDSKRYDNPYINAKPN